MERVSQACAKTRKVLWQGSLALLCGFALMLAVVAPVRAQNGCTEGACVSVGPRLASVDSTQAPLLNLLFTSLLPGSNVNLTVLDWNGLANGDVNLNALITQLGTNLGLSDPSQVLAANITLGQLQLAMAQVLQADGNTLAANALNALPLTVPGLSGTYQLGELLEISLPQGSLTTVRLDALDLITGAVQLYNFKNVLTTPTPISVDTAALGLPGLANTQLWMQVVEPPVYTCGPEGTSFHSAAIRIKENTDLVGGFSLQPVIDAVNAAGLGLTNVTLTQDVLKLQVYADVARAEGTITAIDLVNSAVTFEARPGLVGLYAGTIDDNVFFNRSTVITDAVVTPTTLTTMNLGLDANVLGVGLVHVQVPLTVTVRAAATGAPGMQTFTVNAPWPQTRTLDSGTVSAGTLIVDLLNNLDIEITSGTPTATVLGIPVPLPPSLVPIINTAVDTIETQLQGQANTVLAPAFNALLGGVVDPLLELFGIGIGEAVFTVEGIGQACAAVLTLTKVLQPAADPGVFNLSISQGGTVLASATDVGDGGNTGNVVTTPGDSYDLAEVAGTGTTLAPYVTTWACTDQDGTAISSGTGPTFALTAPAMGPTPVTITCRITNRLRQADLSISKSDGSTTYTPGANATYVITVSNAGPDAVTGATVSDTLPNGVTLFGPWTCSATSGSCSAASGGSAGDQAISLAVDLAAGGQATINVPVSFSANPGAY